MDRPGDDSTCLVVRIAPRCPVNMLSGPPVDKANDNRMVHDFMTSPGKKMVCGGTSANIVARVLNRKIETSINYIDPTLPPVAKIEGIDLVTEGVLTLSRAVDIIRDYLDHQADEYYFRKLDEQNGASMIAKLLLEDCTSLKIFIGKAINPAHQNPNLPITFNIKMQLVENLCQSLKEMGKRVTVTYF